MNKELSIAHDVIQNLKSTKNSITFQKLWDTVSNKLKISESAAADLASDFYIALLENPTFIKLNNNEWTLKEFFSYDDVKKINSPVYPTEEFEINEDEYDKYLSNYEIKQLKDRGNRTIAGLDLVDVDGIVISDSGRSSKTSDLELEDDDTDPEGEEYDE